MSASAVISYLVIVVGATGLALTLYFGLRAVKLI